MPPARPPSQRGVLPFVKMHAAGNAFVLVDALDGLDLDWPRLAIETADARVAVGHDGLLVVLPSEMAQYRQRMLNPDGTEDMCGNGLRCVAKHLHDTGRIGSRVLLETIAGPRAVEVLRADGATAYLRAGLGTPTVRPLPLRLADLPRKAAAAVPSELRDDIQRALSSAVHVSPGTPHVVLHVERDVPEGTWAALSAALETRALRGELTNVTWFRRLSDDAIQARFWERGIGETLSCGTGVAASMVAARRMGIVGDGARVMTRGGELRATCNAEGTVHVEGPATTVFLGEWPLQDRQLGSRT